MSKYLLGLLLIASPAAAQAKLAPKTSVAQSDPCAPIGRTADGKLVYSMKCENLPAPPGGTEGGPVSAAEPEDETRWGGIFGWSYDRR
jgi:hypothetical protein